MIFSLPILFAVASLWPAKADIWKEKAERAVCGESRMDADFDAAAKRFSKDHKSQRDRAKEKAQQKAADLRAHQARKAKYEAEAEARRKADEERRAAEAAARDIDLERNKGVAFVATLRPERSTAAEAKGIVRKADKVVLPPSASRELEAQQAHKNGQLFFEVHCAATDRTTHASILDFSASEGTVGLPDEMLANLGLTHELMAAEQRPNIIVRYRALKRGAFAKVQPVANAFASEIGDVKSLLERELHYRTTLSAGDELKVTDVESAMGTYEPASTYALRIVELEPDGAASIIDTDLEVEVMPSVEYEEAMAAEAAKARARQEALEAQMRAQAEAQAEAARRAAEAAAQAIADEGRRQQERQARREAALGALPPEPAEGGVSVQVRCPDGTRCARRFDAAAALDALFALVESSAWEGAPPGGYALVASYPRRVVRRAAGSTLADAGLTGRQEALLIEMEEPQAEAMDVA